MRISGGGCWLVLLIKQPMLLWYTLPGTSDKTVDTAMCIVTHKMMTHSRTVLFPEDCEKQSQIVYRWLESPFQFPQET